MTDDALPLAELRRHLGRSQAEVAAAMRTTQSGVSRIERQPDMRISTLNEYVRALGGRLRLVVETPDHDFDVSVLARTLSHNGTREYRVIWQNQITRSLLHVGWLTYTGEEFVFTYVEAARTDPEFEPFPAFPSLDGEYRSPDLFPFFSVRLTSAADPAFDSIIQALGLDRDEATPAELLARTPSTSPHDTLQVIPEPVQQPDGSLVRLFLASGMRHVDPNHPERLAGLLASLKPGTPLQLLPEPTNPHNAGAMLLTTQGRRVGWIPDYLLAELHRFQAEGLVVTVRVERANGTNTPWHLRLLCRLTAAPANTPGTPTQSDRPKIQGG